MDTTAAKGSPGVLEVYYAVRLAERCGSPEPAALRRDVGFRCRNKEVTYYGQPVAFVVTGHVRAGPDAAALVAVAYRERPALTSLAERLDSAEVAPPAFDSSPPEIEVLEGSVESIDAALAASWWSSRRPTDRERRAAPRWSRAPRSRCGTTAS